MNSILSVTAKPLFDESITKKQYHTYHPYLQSFKNNDEIRIAVQNQDLYLLPNESLLYIEGCIKLENGQLADNIQHIILKNNSMALLFDEIRYEINGLEIDKTRHLGVTTAIKNYVSLTPNESNILENAGWTRKEFILPSTSRGYFNFCIPLKMLMGFAEDYNKIIINSKHELILLRTKNDGDNFYCTDAGVKNLKLELINVSWKIPHVELADFTKLQIYKTIKSGQPLNITFRTWDCHFNPLLAQSTNNIWNVKLTSNNEKPRFVLIAFYNTNSKSFAHCNLTDVKIHLNSLTYPYDDLNLKFDNDRYALLYEMYCKFQQAYYSRELPHPLLSRDEFKTKAPIIVLDVTHQNEAIKTGSMDIKIEIKTTENIPANTAVYCLLIQDRIMQYVPLTGEIKKII